MIIYYYQMIIRLNNMMKGGGIMFWIGLIALVIFLCFSGLDAGAIILWVSVYAIIGVIIDYSKWNRRR